MLVDVHCHIDEYEDVKSIVKRALEHEVTVIIGVGSDPESNEAVLQAMSIAPQNIRVCIGYHPWESWKATDDELQLIIRQVEENLDRIVGLGEVGMDRRFVRGEDKWRRQFRVFERIVRLAKEYDLPLNIHSVHAERIILELLDRYRIERALFHWYTGSLEVLESIIDRGYYVSVNLALQYSRRAIEVARKTPLSLILLESDAPYMFKEEEAHPWSVAKVAELLARVKELEIEWVKKATTRNAMKLFRIS